MSLAKTALITVLLASTTSADVKIESGSQTENSVVVDDATVPFLFFVPKTYETTDEKLPLMLFLHGLGESGDGNLDLVKRYGPPKLVADKPDFPFIVVSPQCPRPKRSVGSGWHVQRLGALIDELVSQLRVDESRIYVTGLSMGGYGTWRLATAYPKRFAAAIPICGGGNAAKADRLKYLPIWCFHGAKDRVVPPTRSQEMVDAVREAGGSAQLTVYPEAGHDSWTQTYANPKIYDWLLSHRRDD